MTASVSPRSTLRLTPESTERPVVPGYEKETSRNSTAAALPSPSSSEPPLITGSESRTSFMRFAEAPALDTDWKIIVSIITDDST